MVHWTTGRDGPRHVGTPGRLITLWPIKPIIFKLFRPTKFLARFCLKARVQVANNFRRNSFALGNTSLLTPKLLILSRVETCSYQHHISHYSSDVLALLIGWHPGQLPGWHSPIPALLSEYFLKRKATAYSGFNIPCQYTNVLRSDSFSIHQLNSGAETLEDAGIANL